MVHSSIGDVLREKVRQKTESSDLIAEYMVEGRLVPDELAISIVREKIHSPEVQERGWLLDNFPRTSDQAEAMMELGIIPDKFIYVNVPEDLLQERCLGRLVDAETGNIYHSKFSPPPDDPEVKARLERRSDDHEEAVTRRLELFFEGSEDVLEIFNDIKLELDGTAPLKDVIREARLYVRPPAPLYSDVSKRPQGGIHKARRGIQGEDVR
jgi:adenylate kinase